MTYIKNNTESLRNLSKVFTLSNFNKIIRKNEYSLIKNKINKCIDISSSISNNDLIKLLYNELQNNYKSEYIYKNTLLNKLLLGRYSLNTTTVINEFKIGNSIADFILINGELKVFEIKTEFDNLDKLDKQIFDYRQFADRIYVVSCSKHIDKLISIYDESDIGIIEYTYNNTLKEIIIAKENKSFFDHTVIFKTLRKQEYLNIILNYFGFIPDVPNTRIFTESLAMVKSIKVEVFQELAYTMLKGRKLRCPERLKSGSTPYELKHICYSLNMTGDEYNLLDKFLNQKA